MVLREAVSGAFNQNIGQLDEPMEGDLARSRRTAPDRKFRVRLLGGPVVLRPLLDHRLGLLKPLLRREGSFQDFRHVGMTIAGRPH